LLFWLFLQMTGSPGPSVFVAACFAVHPLHVESVAWVAERKDVLSTFFGFLTLCAYIRYVRRPRIATYIGLMGFFSLALMTKPMLVSLPLILLLLDFWPLGRFTLEDTTAVPHLIREKMPLMALTGISSLVTFFVQSAAGAVANVPIAARIENAGI